MDVLPAGRFIFLAWFNWLLWELCNYDTTAKRGERMFSFFCFRAVFP